MINNDYYSIAYSEYEFLLNNLNLGYCNQTLPMMQQVCEKLLKSVIIDLSLLDPDDVIMRSHKLDRIYDAIRITDNPITNNYSLNVRDLSWLTGFYFDCRYPGNNFINADSSQESDGLEIMKNVFNYVNNIRRDYSNINSISTQPVTFGGLNNNE